MNLIHVDASKRFLDRSKVSPIRRSSARRIGAEFIAVFEDEARKLGQIPWLAQGTLYPDVIESVSFKGPSATIKTHHNVGGLPPNMRFKLVEPLRELFKDEVRELGAVLGLPAEIIWRQPFPGPGLAIRVLGEVTEERLALLREADAIVQEEVRQAGLERELWQAFAVLLPIRTVGVMGDFRTYAQVIALRAVSSQDAMTADWARLPYDLLGRISSRIINEVQGRQPRRLRHLLQAAEHHRVGVIGRMRALPARRTGRTGCPRIGCLRDSDEPRRRGEEAEPQPVSSIARRQNETRRLRPSARPLRVQPARRGRPPGEAGATGPRRSSSPRWP